ncbi:NAD(P)H-dependent oxidoreductase [Vacuolonema iberomarrocanum]|uniref:NAD(P)H-dependent oxidoreductase n=1 Tax=Vacuolonema iberomarrocanum TaxID=3454632 RepID=UPI0019DECEB9|nr:NAD(P)H-dependent oxidoreductase [filamentous cyanobacterium LEGE 07170]
MSNSPISSDQLLQQLNWRYATKAFDAAKKIPAETWQTLEEAIVLSPSSFGLQPWKFVVVTDPEIRKTLQEHAWGQAQVSQSSHLIVFARKLSMSAADVDRYINYMAEEREIPAESLKGFSDMVKGFLQSPPYPMDIEAWTARQTYIAVGQFLTSAALLGIDVCPMEGFVPAKVDETLGLTQQGYGAVVLCAAGYRADDDKYANLKKVRYPKSEVITHL